MKKQRMEWGLIAWVIAALFVIQVALHIYLGFFKGPFFEINAAIGAAGFVFIAILALIHWLRLFSISKSAYYSLILIFTAQVFYGLNYLNIVSVEITIGIFLMELAALIAVNSLITRKQKGDRKLRAGNSLLRDKNVRSDNSGYETEEIGFGLLKNVRLHANLRAWNQKSIRERHTPTGRHPMKPKNKKRSIGKRNLLLAG